MLTLKELEVITRSGIDLVVKPIFIFTVDGGPDENPRYQAVIRVAIHHFLRYDFDSLFIATNAPGKSAFNRVERKMAPLSKELTGLILPHELEKKNFKFVGVTLAEIWSQIIVDKFPTVAEFIEPTESELLEENLLSIDQK